MISWWSKRAARASSSRHATKGTRTRSRWQPTLEQLEDRLVPSTYTVNSSNDSGPGSLRQAILDANANAGLDTIGFNLPTYSYWGDVAILQANSPLPAVTDPVTIDGLTEPGSSPSSPRVVLFGTYAGNTSGLTIQAGGSTVRGLMVGGFARYGIELTTAGSNVIEANYLGSRYNGYFNLPSNRLGGLGVLRDSNANTISANVLASNTASGNCAGAYIQSDGNTLVGNFIGTDRGGEARLGNGLGVWVDGGSNNVLGGTTLGTSNLISGNDAGILLDGSLRAVTHNVVQGNLIGTNGQGTQALGGVGNLSFNVCLKGDALDNVIGGTTPDAGNVISGSNSYNSAGISLVGAGVTRNRIQGNRIGTNAAGTAKLPNRVGIAIADAPGNLIGGTEAGAGNLISGNAASSFDQSYAGMMISGATATANVVQGNRFGLDASATALLKNEIDLTITDANGTVVGGTSPGARNLFGAGVRVKGTATGTEIQGNFFGTNADGTVSLGYGGVDLYSPSNHVGGTTAAARNVMGSLNISGYGATGNVVEGNYIGVDATGSKRLEYTLGVRISYASGTRIGGTAPGAGNVISGSGNYPGIRLWFGANGTLIQGNLIGTDATGQYSLGNSESGIVVDYGAHDNLIGGTDPAARNVISGNGQRGVLIDGIFSTSYNPSGKQMRNVVQGNYIGTDVTGTRAVPNIYGVDLESDTAENVIGGTVPGAGNLISGNLYYGLYVAGASGTLVQGNLIGTDVTGMASLGNSYAGVYLWTNALGNTIGGALPGAGNVISGNGFAQPADSFYGAGVVLDNAKGNVLQGNIIGADRLGTGPLANNGGGIRMIFATNNVVGGTAEGAGNIVAYNTRAGVTVYGQSSVTGNTIRGNPIFDNGRLGIDLTGGGRFELASGVTPNDGQDPDTGPNDYQNYPVLTAAGASGNTLTVVGSLNSKPNATYTLDFYASLTRDASTFGEGKRYLGSATVQTDGSGNAPFSVLLAQLVAAGQFITATATDAAGSTSEFSMGLAVLSTNAAPTADAGGPYTSQEGNGLSLDGSRSSDPDGDALTYSWDVNGDGLFGDAQGVQPNLSWTRLQQLGIDDGPTVYRISLRVDDGYGHVATSSPVSLSLANTAPGAVLTNGGAVNEGSTGTVSFTNPFDPSTADTAAGFHYAFDFDNNGTFDSGNGTYAGSGTSATATIPASYFADGPGTRTVKGRILDKDGASTDYTTVITIHNVDVSYTAGGDQTLPPAAAGAFARTVPFTDPGADTWSGTVNYGDNTGTQPLAVNPTNKTFTLSHTYTAQGTYPVTVTLKDDDGTPVTQTFNVTVILNTPPTIAQDGNPVVVQKGQPAAKSGTFGDAQGNGTVALSASLGSVVKDDATGTWSWTAGSAGLPLGSQSVTLTATDNFGETAFTYFTLTVNPVATTTTITAPAIVYGADGVVTVTVGPAVAGLATPTGNVALAVDGGTAITQALANGTTVFTLPGLTAGPHSLAASYTVQGDFAASSQAGSMTVNQAPLSVVVAAAAKVYGEAVPTLGGTLTGVVAGDNITASYSTTASQFSAPGGYAITVTLNDPNGKLVNYAITNTPAVLTVRKASSSTTGAVSAPTPLFGVDGITLSAIVSVVAPGSGSLTGTVTFFDGTTALGTVSLVNGAAALALGSSALAAGPHTITAVYTGDDNLAGSENTAYLRVLAPATVQGLVYIDFNNDGLVDFGEKAVGQATVTLSGTDDLGNPVSRVVQTDAQGVYEFTNLRPSSVAGYTISETQPAGLPDGLDSLGTIGGVSVGIMGNDTFTGLVLGSGKLAEDYNFGERAAATGAVGADQTATIGFWQNMNGQNLILSLNGGGAGTQLGSWLATTFPNMYAGLAGKTNADVAAFYKGLFARTAQTAPGGPPKMDAQVMATALAVYVTNASLGGSAGTAYGFLVTDTGLGTRTFDVGSNGSAFGVANHTAMTVMDLLMAVNTRSKNGRLYDLDGDGTTEATEVGYRMMANDVFEGLNKAGHI